MNTLFLISVSIPKAIKTLAASNLDSLTDICNNEFPFVSVNLIYSGLSLI